MQAVHHSGRWLIRLSLATLLLTNCGGPQDTTFEVTPQPPVTVTPTQCFWTEGYGAGSEEVESQVAQAFTAAGIVGAVSTGSYGENSSCDGYHAKALDFDITLQVTDSTAPDTLEALVAQVEAIIQQAMSTSPIPNLGNIRIRFRDQARACLWDFVQKRCTNP